MHRVGERNLSPEEVIKLATSPIEKLAEEFKTTRNPAFQYAIFEKIAAFEKNLAEKSPPKDATALLKGNISNVIDYELKGKVPGITPNIIDYALDETLANKCAVHICTIYPVDRVSKEIAMSEVATRTKFDSVAEVILETLFSKEEWKKERKFEMLGKIGSETQNPATVKRVIDLINLADAPEEYKLEGIGRMRLAAGSKPSSVQRSVLDELKIPYSDEGKLQEHKKEAWSLLKTSKLEEALETCDKALELAAISPSYKLSSKERSHYALRLSDMREVKGDVLLKMGRKEEAFEAYLLAAHALGDIGVTDLTIIRRKLHPLVRESESPDKLGEFNAITAEPNPVVRIQMAKEHLSKFLDGMVETGGISKKQRGDVYNVLMGQSVALEKEYSLEGVSVRASTASEEVDVTKREKKLDARGGKLEWGLTNRVQIPDWHMMDLAFEISSYGKGTISGANCYKIALEHSRAFMSTLLDTGGKVVEFGWMETHYNPLRSKMGVYALWG